jgi:uncharacterized membrane protein YphA (DoxX/SURF4 family)
MSSSVIYSIITLVLGFYLAFILLLSGFNQFMSSGEMNDDMKNLGIPSIFIYFFYLSRNSLRLFNFYKLPDTIMFNNIVIIHGSYRITLPQ